MIDVLINIILMIMALVISFLFFSGGTWVLALIIGFDFKWKFTFIIWFAITVYKLIWN